MKFGSESSGTFVFSDESLVVNNTGISFEDGFGLPIEICCNLMNLIFVATAGTAEFDLTAATGNFQFLFAFSTTHSL